MKILKKSGAIFTMNRAKISGKTDPEIPARRCPPTALQNSQKSANPDLQNPKNDNSESEKKNMNIVVTAQNRAF